MKVRTRVMMVVAAGALVLAGCGDDDGGGGVGGGDGGGGGGGDIQDQEIDGQSVDAVLDMMSGTLDSMGMEVDEDCLRDTVEELMQTDPETFGSEGAVPDASLITQMMDCVDMSSGG